MKNQKRILIINVKKYSFFIIIKIKLSYIDDAASVKSGKSMKSNDKI